MFRPMWPSSGNTQVGRNMYITVNSENNKKSMWWTDCFNAAYVLSQRGCFE